MCNFVIIKLTIGVKFMEDFFQNVITYAAFTSILGIIITKFINKDSGDDNITGSDVVAFRIKKNAKIVLYIVCFVFLFVMPALSINTIIKDREIGLLIVNLFLIILAILSLLVVKYDKIIYKNGIFRKKNIFGKTRIYKFDDVVRVKYSANEKDSYLTLYLKNNKKLEIHSYYTNFNWVLKEIKIRKIEIYNKVGLL